MKPGSTSYVLAVIADKLGVAQNTWAQWQHRGYIPPSRHHEFVKTAHDLGLPLDHDILHRMWKQNFKSRGKQGKGKS